MDKLEQVKKEIERRRDIFRTSVASIDGCKANVLTDILNFIDSLQEELVSNDVLDAVDKKARKIWDEINTGHEYSIIDSYNQFYGICMEIAEMVQEEPHCDERQFDELSKLQEGIGQIAKAVYEYKGKENPTVEKIREILIENSFDRMEIRGEISKKEEPVSEDLEEAAKEWSLSNQEGFCTHSMKVAAFKAGAKWQKEQMMKDAVDASVSDTRGDYPSLTYGHIDMMFALEDMKVAIGDKVKLIIIQSK